jgi:hypothetical protein
MGRLETLERVKGIEPSYAAWEAAVLPLNYTRELRDFNGGRVTAPIGTVPSDGVENSGRKSGQ